MKFNLLFPSFVSVNQLDVDNQAIIDWCYRRYNICPQPKIKGGWQSTPFDISVIDDPAVIALKDAINKDVLTVRHELGISADVEHRFSNFWININEPGNFLLDSNTPHVHPACFLSCVYYPKGELNSGDLYLLSPFNGVVERIPYAHLERSTGYCDTRWSIKPEPGKLVIFPSWLMHWVTPNYSNDDRISIAFNISLPTVDASTVGTVCV